MSVNWKKLSRKIPNRVQVSKNEYWEVLYVDDFVDGKTLGETRFHSKQVVIKKGLSPKTTVIVYMHELVHLFANVCDITLTETDVLKTEKAYYYLLKEGNIFKNE